MNIGYSVTQEIRDILNKWNKKSKIDKSKLVRMAILYIDKDKKRFNEMVREDYD